MSMWNSTINLSPRSLMEPVKACNWRNNEHELQDILDTKSVACGYHCAIYLPSKTLLQISVDQINTIYLNEGCNQEDNDTFAVQMGEVGLQTSQETIIQNTDLQYPF